MTDAVQRVWTDADGRSHQLPPATVSTLRAALGRPPADGERTGPVVTRPGLDPGLGEMTVRCEDGTVRTVHGTIPPDFPLGYHRALTADGERRLIVSPGRCFLPEKQTWGWAVQLYATHSRDSWGIGDLRDLRRLREWTAQSGGGFLLVNPLHAVAPGTPQESSPYLPTTRRFLNPIYLCVPEVPGHEPDDVDIGALAAVRSASRVDRDAVSRLKLGALRAAFVRGAAEGDFRSWRAAQDDDVEEFALWCVLAEVHGSDWRSWPEELRDPAGPGAAEARSRWADDVSFHVWLQWQLAVQLGAAGRDFTLVQDLPVGVSGSGADAWAWQGLLATGVSVGAPPDKLNSLGQDWGSPPWVPWRLQEADYEPFVQTVRRTLSAAGGLRIDHVMGLFRLWWVPADGGPAEGGYVRYPHDDLLDIIALESHRAQAVVVGEDLGTVEDGVADALARRRILSYKVLWFEEDHPRSWPERAMATVTTHDLPTVRGLWTGTDAREQRELTDMGAEDIAASRAELLTRLDAGDLPPDPDDHTAAILSAYRRLVQAPSLLLCLGLEDAAGQERRPNMPGTVADRNWSLPLPVLVEDLPHHPGAKSLVDLVQRRRDECAPGRLRRTSRPPAG